MSYILQHFGENFTNGFVVKVMMLAKSWFDDEKRS